MRAGWALLYRHSLTGTPKTHSQKKIQRSKGKVQKGAHIHTITNQAAEVLALCAYRTPGTAVSPFPRRAGCEWEEPHCTCHPPAAEALVTTKGSSDQNGLEGRSTSQCTLRSSREPSGRVCLLQYAKGFSEEAA